MEVKAGGKLVVLGEYHVLDPGGRALVAGVAPGVRVRLDASDRYALDCPDVGVEGLRGDPGDGGRMRWERADAETLHRVRFAQCALELALALSRDRVASSRPFRVRVESELGSGADKAGLGGSAAVVAAVAAAALAWNGRELTGPADRGLLLRAGLAAHHRAQDGRGSGVDVAAAIAGGLALYRNPGLDARLGDALEPDALAARVVGEWSALELRAHPWPADHVLLAGASGRGASTRSFLGRFAALQGAEAERYLALRVDLGSALVHFGEDGRTGDEIGAAMCRHQELLERFDASLGGAGICTPETDRLVEIARAMDLPAKISGAGGGDSVIALARGAEAEELASRWREAGFDVRSLDGGAPALSVEGRAG